MSKREAEFQIHNQPMSEAEIRTTNRMNNQTPSKATPAQLAARKIREAKSSMARRRTPGLSPAPTGPSFSNTQPTPSFTNTQPTPSFFPANPATSAFGVNGVETPAPQQQQPFAAPSSSTFNFTASTGTNPFAASQPSNPFSNQNSSIQFGQQAPGGVQQSSIFSQPSGPQQPSNPFGVASNFSFGQSTGVNNSFPPTQNTSIFSKSTPAASSFTFGSNPSFSQAPPSGAAPQTSAADHDVSMDASESPFKSPRKPTTADQPAETKPTPSIFGGSTPFSFTPANNGSVEETNSKPSINLGNSMFRPKNTAAQQPPQNSASIFSQSSKSAEQTSPDKTTQPSAPIFNFFPKPIESEKEAPEKQIASASTHTFKPFAPPGSGETEKLQETKAVTPFPFGTFSEPSQKQNHEQPLEQKAQGAAPFNPFQSLQSSDSASVPSQPLEQISNPAPLQFPQPSGSTSFNPFQPLKADDSHQTQPSDSFNALQPSKVAGAEASQNALQSSVFQTAKPSEAENSADGSSQSSGRTSSLFRTLQPGAEGFSKAAPPPLKSALKKPSYTQSKVTVTPQLAEANASPPKEDASAPASTSTFEPPQLAKSPETQANANNTHPGIGASANVPEQPDEANAKGTRRASETSNLFAQSLGQASKTASQDAGNLTPTSQAERSTGSPTKSAAAPQKVDSQLPTATAPPSTSTSEPIVVKVKSHGASAVPQELSNDEFADFDKSYRLRSLNSQFKKRIAELDPEKHDFEPIIRFYATQRDAIGHPIGGLYHRVKAGEKRKTEEAERDELVPNPAKRTKIDNTAATSDQQAYRPVLGFSAITSVSTSPQPPAEASSQMETECSVFKPDSISNGSITAHQAATSSNTSNVFKSMLSSSSQGPFGNCSPPPASSVSTLKPAEQPTQLFGSSSFTPLNKTKFAFQNDIQSNSNGTNYGSSSSSQKTSQLFQPKAAAGSIVEPPKFATAGGTDFMSAFSAQAKKNAAKMEAENKAKRKAEEFDSDEDDEAEYERKVAEEDRAKRARIESIVKAASGFTPVLSAASSTNGASPVAEQAEESIRHDEANESDQSQGDEASGSEASHDYGAGDDDLEEDENDEEEDIEDSQEDHGEDDETDEDDDIQTAMTKSHANAKNSFSPSSDPKSLFNRITKPEAPSEDKGSKTDGASPPVQANNSSIFSAPPGTGLFGSRPTTPSLDSPKPFGSSIFSNPVSSNTPTADNTWKPGSAIKFGAPTSAPAVNITPATPLAKTNGYSTQGPSGTFSAEGPASTASKAGADNNNNSSSSPRTTTSVFGAPSFPAQSAAGSFAGSPKPFSNLFGDASKKTTVNQSSAANVGFTFGGPSKLGPSPFLAPSNASSAITSRATSPGLTDNDSAAESGPDEQAKDPQSDLMTLRPGEENEDILFEVRTKALEPMTEKELTAIGSKDEAGWKTRGLGPLRVLKNSETGRARIVMRAEPGANVVINSQLIHDNKYDLNPSGKEGASLKMGVFMDGKFKSWVFKIKTMKIAHELVDCLKENEPPARDADSD